MSLSELEQTVLAYFLAVPANDINIAGRFYPYSEVILIIEDKVSIATRKFGPKARAASKAVATAFVDAMLEKGGWSTKKGEYGGSMHQFQPDVYRTALLDMQAANPLIAKSQGEGPEFWAESIAKQIGA